MNYEFPVLSVGVIAERELANFSGGRVIAAFDTSFYVETDTGIICVVGLGQGSSPLNISVAVPSGMSWRASGIDIGVRGRIVAKKLCVGNEFFFPLGHATVWRAPPPPADVVPRNVEKGLSALVQVFAERGIEEGLGKFIDPVFQPGERNIIERGAAPAIEKIRRWLVGEFRCYLAICPPCDNMLLYLSGLGPGLTPSGSDFLGAVMIALNALKADKLRDCLWSRLLPVLRLMGNPIVAAHLAAAAKGMGAAALHRMLNAVISGEVEAIRDLAREIDVVGHSSGWDAMAGFSLVLDAWRQSLSPN